MKLHLKKKKKKNTQPENFVKHTQISIAKSTKWKEGYQFEGHFAEIRHADKTREKRMKSNEQSLQEIWDFIKRPNQCLTGVPEGDGENGNKLENTLQDIMKENFPNLKDRPTCKFRKYREHY